MFPKTSEALLERLLLQKANIGTYKLAVSATVQEQTDITEDSANLQYVLGYADLIEANKKTVTQIKNAVYNGDPDEPISAFPVFPAAAPPFPVRAGIEERFNRRSRRFKTADGYTKEIGIALGIEQPETNTPSPDDLIAAITLKDLGGYQYQGEFLKQGQSAMLIEQRIKGTEKWFEAKTALVSPVTVNVNPPAVEGAAVQLEIRARLMKGNLQVGQWSPIYLLTVNP